MDSAELVCRRADRRLLAEADLPQSFGRPQPPPPSRARTRIVALGVTLTGAALAGGASLLALGIVLALSGSLGLAGAALAVGAVLVATHWGWVHVAEATADTLERRRNRAALEHRQRWLEQIRPYTRYEITTAVEDDGSIRIVRTRYEPVALGERSFTFASRVEHQEVHGAEEPGARVAERAELLRRQAAADTERERRRFEIAADAHQSAMIGAEDERRRRAAERAASEALSERINANLRDPPLVE